MKTCRLLCTWLIFVSASINSYSQIPWEIEIIKPEAIGLEPGFSYSSSPLNSPNYYQLGRVFVEQADGKRKMVFKVLEYKTMKVIDLHVPMDNFPTTHMQALEMKQVFNGDILYFNGKVSTIKFDRRVNYKNTGEFVCQYNHETGTWSELIKLGDVDDMRYFYPMEVDRSEKYYYYAIAHRYDSGPRLGEPIKYDLARLDLNALKVDSLFTLDMPKRGHYLHLDHTMLSPDGKYLVLSEYGDKAWRKSHPNDAQPVAYIINTETKTFITSRIPDTPYGHFITPDSKYMLLGSYETGSVVKIELETGKQVATIKSTTTIFNFFPAPSGNYFLVDYDYEKCPRKVYDVRSTHDLSLITSVMLEDLYSQPGMSQSLYSIFDNRLVISSLYDKTDTLDRAPAVLIHRLPENIKANEPGSSTAMRLELAETIANGKLYAAKNNIELNPAQYDLGNTTSVTISSDNLVLVTGCRYLDDETSEQVILKLTRSGEKIWETTLPTVQDAFSSPGMHIPTPDGGCIVYFMYYHHPKSLGIGRVAKIDGTGKVIYDTQFVHQPNPNSTYMTKGMELQEDGTLKIFGEIFPDANAPGIPWVGTLSVEGVLVKSEY